MESIKFDTDTAIINGYVVNGLPLTENLSRMEDNGLEGTEMYKGLLEALNSLTADPSMTSLCISVKEGNFVIWKEGFKPSKNELSF